MIFTYKKLLLAKLSTVYNYALIVYWFSIKTQGCMTNEFSNTILTHNTNQPNDLSIITSLPQLICEFIYRLHHSYVIMH